MRVPVAIFNNKHDAAPKNQSFTLEELTTKLTRHVARESKGGVQLFSPVTYQEGTRRGNRGIDRVHAFVGDFDDGCLPEEFEALWAGWHHVVYSTYSTGIEKDGHPPCCRFRVIFPFQDPVPVADWPAAWERINVRLCRGLCDPACKDAARMYLLPSCPPNKAQAAFGISHPGKLLDLEELEPLTETTPAERPSRTRPLPSANFEAVTSWEQILGPHGGQVHSDRCGRTLFTRPGKAIDAGPSAITVAFEDGSEGLHVFTSNWPPFEPNRSYGKFGAYALLNHGGDYAAAAAALATPKRVETAYATDAPVVASAASEEEEEFNRLLGLSDLERERELKRAAKQLGVGVVFLRKELARRNAVEGRDNLQGSPVTIEEHQPWPEQVDGAALLSELVTAINRFIWLPQYGAEAVALWILHTYVYDLFDWSPKLGILSPVKRCGKSSLLLCITLTACRAKDTKSISPAALFRIIAAHKPTILIDEADTISKENEDMRGLLNSSSQRRAKLTRCVGDSYEPRDFDVFAAIAYAMISEPWPTVLDRSIVIRMERKPAEVKKAKMRFGTAVETFAPLASKATRWALDSRATPADMKPEMPESLDDRAADIWEPLVAIADLVGGVWPELARRAAINLTGGRDEDEKSTGIRLLRDVRAVFRGERMSSEEICQMLVKVEESSWSDCRKGKPIDPRSLASMLKPFGITSKTIRVGDQTPKGYERESLEKAFSSYLPPITSETPQQEGTADGHEH